MNETKLDDIDGRARRIETRITRLMLALGVDPGKTYTLGEAPIFIDKEYREIHITNTNVALIDMANAITAEGGDLAAAWSVMLNNRSLGTLSFAR